MLINQAYSRLFSYVVKWQIRICLTFFRYLTPMSISFHYLCREDFQPQPMFRQLLNEKIGNALLYLTEHVTDISLIKAIKLLYLIDETSVKEVGVPVTWMEYKAWKHGPVPVALYNEFKSSGKGCQENASVMSYLTASQPSEKVLSAKTLMLKSKKAFDDSAFSDYEMELMDRVIAKFGSYTAEELIDHLHAEGSLWSSVVEQNDLQKYFELQGGKTEFGIPLTTLIVNDPHKSAAYNSAYHSLDFQQELLFKS